MTKSSRRKLFYVLSVIFIVATPLLVFYSLGYTLNIFEARIGRVGSIFVKSERRGISIFLNNRLIKETLFATGSILSGIEPGVYLLRVEKNGYYSWSKTVEVKPEIVTELRNVLLIPKNLRAATSTPEELTKVLATSTPSLFSLDKKRNLVMIENKKVRVIAPGVVAFHDFSGEVFFVDKNGFVARFNAANEKTDILGHPGFYLAPGTWRWLKSPDGNLVIIDPSGGLFLLKNSGNIIPVDGGVKDVSFDSRGRKLLIQKEYTLEVLWLQDNIFQPFQKEGTRETIISLKEPIRDSSWFYGDDAHILLRSGGGIFLTELDGRGGRYTVELVSGKSDGLLTSPVIPNAVFYKEGGVWFKIEL